MELTVKFTLDAGYEANTADNDQLLKELLRHDLDGVKAEIVEAKGFDREERNAECNVSNSAIIDYIETDAEAAIEIDSLFNKDGSVITRKRYGHFLLKSLVKELRAKFIN